MCVFQLSCRSMTQLLPVQPLLLVELGDQRSLILQHYELALKSSQSRTNLENSWEVLHQEEERALAVRERWQ